ncbi:DUF308 domain-containing protein [Nocardioides sp. GY 10127]|uniref:HdeD family acid-resistance protein n=1 Tax=Nocardioides sp. GY 10127 TaxID=2569762 RepID=UPI0010A8B789|nr:DUF308 domain-containing protein [Nocardioides sp. GY 10127]TIC84163.1 sulfate permease [Nocardioides sp. GY 10127]
MAEAVKSRTGWDLLLGGLMVLGGVIVLSYATVATVVSVLFTGWTTLILGVVGLVIALTRIGKEGFWTGLLGSGLFTVLGLVMVRNPAVAAVSLTLVAGAMFLTTGIARLAAAVQIKEARVPLIISGGMSTLLGLVILFNLFAASFTLLGVLLGIEMLFEGFAVMIAGRSNLTSARVAGLTTPSDSEPTHA